MLKFKKINFDFSDIYAFMSYKKVISRSQTKITQKNPFFFQKQLKYDAEKTMIIIIVYLCHLLFQKNFSRRSKIVVTLDFQSEILVAIILRFFGIKFEIRQ